MRKDTNISIVWVKYMENIVFERDYSQDQQEDERRTDIFERAMYGSFAKDFQSSMEKIPKVIVPEYKANYEYLLRVCDDLARQWGGSVRGVVDYQHWDAKIDLDLPLVEFANPKDLQLLCDMAEKSHTISFQPNESGGINIHIFNLYFEELMSDLHREYLRYEAIMNDPELAEMLGMSTEPSPEVEAFANFLDGLLSKVEKATGGDRTEIFKELLHRVGENDSLDHIIELWEQAADDMIEEAGDVSL